MDPALRTVIDSDLVRLHARALALVGSRRPAVEAIARQMKKRGTPEAAIRIGMQQTISQSQIFEKSLHELWKAKIISLETAQAHATTPAILDQMRFGTYVPPTLDRMIQQSLE